jgi:elongation factor G
MTDTRHPLLIKLEPKIRSDWSNFASALTSLAQSDATVSFALSEEKGEARVGGMSELHLDEIVKSFVRQGIAVNVGTLQITYLETITRKVTKDYTHKRQTGGTGQFARVIFEIEPNEKGAGNTFESTVCRSSVPEVFIPGIEKGLNSFFSSGPLIGFPVVDMKVALVDGAYHDADSTPIAFEIATRAAMREAFDMAGAVLLEPMMKVEVNMPEEFIGSIIGDLHKRRGQILGTASGNAHIIKAIVPLANMLGYGLKLNTQTNGRASCTMEFSGYLALEPTPDPGNFRPAMGMRA